MPDISLSQKVKARLDSAMFKAFILKHKLDKPITIDNQDKKTLKTLQKKLCSYRFTYSQFINKQLSK